LPHDQKSMVSGQWSVVNGQWSVISDQKSEINHLSFASSVIN